MEKHRQHLRVLLLAEIVPHRLVGAHLAQHRQREELTGGGDAPVHPLQEAGLDQADAERIAQHRDRRRDLADYSRGR